MLLRSSYAKLYASGQTRFARRAYWLGVHTAGELKAPVQQSAGERVALQGERHGWKVGGVVELLLLLLLALLVVAPPSVGEGWVAGPSGAASSVPGAAPGLLLCGGDCWR